MDIRILFILTCIIICLWLLFTNNRPYIIYENFSKEDNKILELKEDSFFTEQQIINLFKNDNVIQISIPDYYIARIVYKENKIIQLKAGIRDVYKYLDNNIIYKIDIIPDYYLINNVINPGHAVQDWKFNYFSHDYYNPYNILYPYAQIKKYNYYNFPRYNQYTSKYINHKLLNNIYFHKTKKIYN